MEEDIERAGRGVILATTAQSIGEEPVKDAHQPIPVELRIPTQQGVYHHTHAPCVDNDELIPHGGWVGRLMSCC